MQRSLGGPSVPGRRPLVFRLPLTAHAPRAWSASRRPATDNHVPVIAGLEAGELEFRNWRAEVIAAGFEEGQELGGHQRAEGVRTAILTSPVAALRAFSRITTSAALLSAVARDTAAHRRSACFLDRGMAKAQHFPCSQGHQGMSDKLCQGRAHPRNPGASMRQGRALPGPSHQSGDNEEARDGRPAEPSGARLSSLSDARARSRSRRPRA